MAVTPGPVADSRQWESLCDRGSQAFQYGRLELAEEYYWEAVNTAKTFGEFDPRLATSLNNLAVVLRSRGRVRQVEDLYNLALRIWKVVDSGHECMAMSLNNAAGFHQRIGSYAEARQLYKRALEIYEEREQPEDYLLAACLSNLAYLYTQFEKYQQAETLYKRARRIAESILGKDHHNVALVLSGMGDLYTRLKKYSRAETLLVRALECLQRTQGPQHPDVATCLVHMGDLYFQQSRKAGELAMGPSLKRQSVEPLYQAALSIRERRLGSSHPDCAEVYRKIAVILSTQGKPEKAEHLLRRSLQIYLDAYGPYHIEVASCLEDCANLMRQQRRFDEVKKLEERASRLRVRQQELARTKITVFDD